ncbi:MAG: hypothetical protein IJD16_09585 [Desulfovibrio sp.]|nr:hypothetical protein [Desulfovibrio sp.]
MRHFLFIFMVSLAFYAPAWGQHVQAYDGLGVSRDAPQISEDYLAQARGYREAGRYELARQSYALALSTCQSPAEMEVIKRELDGVELILRSLR